MIASIFLILILFTGAYFLILSPKLSQVTMRETELKNQEKLLSVMKTQEKDTSPVTGENVVELQKKVPVKPLTEQLLMDINKAEVMSGSFVVDMQFGNGEDKEQTNLEKQTNTQSNIDGKNDGTGNQQASTNQKEASGSLPEGVKKVTVDMTVESPSYVELEKFISAIEKSDRITSVEAIEFTANDEIISNEQSDKILTYQIKLSVFYMPTLSDLISQLPKLDVPTPAGKKNPLSRFGDYSSDRVENINDYISKEPPADKQTDVNANAQNTTNKKDTNKIIEKQGKKYKVISYKVRPGERIFDLAIKYYNNIKGVELIQKWNKIKKPQELQAGTTIEIPIPLDGEI